MVDFFPFNKNSYNDSGGGADVGLIILAAVGVVLGLLLIIRAATQ